MKQPLATALDRLAYGLAVLFALDRLLKLAAVIHFFRRPVVSRKTVVATGLSSSSPAPLWPTVTLLQPITRGASGLESALRSRGRLDYPAALQHLLICDAQDLESQAVCKAFLEEIPGLHATSILVESSGLLRGGSRGAGLAPAARAVATKLEKLQAALPSATGEALCFLDDDVTLRPTALRVLLPYLFEPGAGAVFGLACYTNWRTPWSSLMSAFVNANALMSYIPLTYLTSPFTITGHCFALHRSVFHAAGGFDGMEGRIDDDHELARRLRRIGLRSVQTPLIYDVDNDLPSLRAYVTQIKRWFIMPRQAMAPFLTPWEGVVSLIGSVGNLLPGLLALLALLTRRRSAWGALGASLGLFGVCYALCEARYLDRHTPLRRWPLILVAGLLTPLQAAGALLSSNEIEWRGQRLHIRCGGQIKIVPDR